MKWTFDSFQITTQIRSTFWTFASQPNLKILGPGPINGEKVMMTGVTFTGRGHYREYVPAIASRRLGQPQLWQIAVPSGPNFKSTEFKLEASTRESYK